jgi:hypothetical protein
MKRNSRILVGLAAFVISAAAFTQISYGDPNGGSVNGPSDTVANGVPTGKTTTGSTPPSPNIVVAPTSPAAASSGAVVTSPTGVYKGTGSSPQNQATGDANSGSSPSKP